MRAPMMTPSFLIVLCAFVEAPEAFAQGGSQVAPTDLVYGPETLLAGPDQPSTAQRRIPTTGFDGPYVLHVRSGTDQRSHRCSSVTVRMDGAVVVGRGDYLASRPLVRREVHLGNPATLEVTLQDRSGCESTVWITGRWTPEQSPASACLSRVFGPEDLVRDPRRRAVARREFPVDGFQPPYVLHVQNGGPDGVNMVSGAEVRLNGRVLVSPSDLSEGVASHTITVSNLTNPSRLEVTYGGKVGSSLRVWIMGRSSVVSPYDRVVIDPEGGRYRFPSGLALDVPPGAVSGPVTLGACLAEAAVVEPGFRQDNATPSRFAGGLELDPPSVSFQAPVVVTLPVRARDAASDVPVLFHGVARRGAYEQAATEVVYDGRPPHLTFTLVASPTAAPPAGMQAAVSADQVGPVEEPCRVSTIVRYVDGSPLDCAAMGIFDGKPATWPAPESYPGCLCVPLQQKAVTTERDIQPGDDECFNLTSRGHVTYEYCDPDQRFTWHFNDVLRPVLDIAGSGIPLQTCDELPLQAVVVDATCHDITTAHIRWRVSDPTKARLASATGYQTTLRALEPPGVHVFIEAGCQHETSEFVSIEKARVGTVAVTPAEATLRIGQVQALQAEIRSTAGEPLDCLTEVEWTSSPSGVVNVESTGELGAQATAIGPGTAMVTAKVDSVVSPFARVVVEPPGPVFVHLVGILPHPDQPGRWVGLPLVGTKRLHLWPGQQLVVEAAVLDQMGVPVPVDAVTWSASGVAIAPCPDGCGPDLGVYGDPRRRQAILAAGSEGGGQITATVYGVSATGSVFVGKFTGLWETSGFQDQYRLFSILQEGGDLWYTHPTGRPGFYTLAYWPHCLASEPSPLGEWTVDQTRVTARGCGARGQSRGLIPPSQWVCVEGCYGAACDYEGAECEATETVQWRTPSLISRTGHITYPCVLFTITEREGESTFEVLGDSLRICSYSRIVFCPADESTSEICFDFRRAGPADISQIAGYALPR
jgi:hypothetical protein